MANESQAGRNVAMMVLTRNIDTSENLSRLNCIRAVREVAREKYDIELFYLKSLLEERRYVSLVTRALADLLHPGKSMPLQCILFDNRARARKIIEEIGRLRPSVVYFDTVRCITTILKVRKKYPDLRIVCDFDDLMSRRCALVLKADQGFSLGYISRYMNNHLRALIENKRIIRWVLRREERTLREAERQVCSVAQKVVLVGAEDARELVANCNTLDASHVEVAAPCFCVVRKVKAPERPLRFVFIGSDRQTQNRLTINWLIHLWSKQRIDIPLHIFSPQQREYPAVHNVILEGYAESLDQVYTSNSILFAPSFLAGGVKTKVLEALSYGVIPLGTEISFESMGIADNVLAMTQEELQKIPFEIESQLPQLVEATGAVQDQLYRCNCREAYKEKWLDILAAH